MIAKIKLLWSEDWSTLLAPVSMALILFGLFLPMKNSYGKRATFVSQEMNNGEAGFVLVMLFIIPLIVTFLLSLLLISEGGSTFKTVVGVLIVMGLPFIPIITMATFFKYLSSFSFPPFAMTILAVGGVGLIVSGFGLLLSSSSTRGADTRKNQSVTPPPNQEGGKVTKGYDYNDPYST